MSFRLPRPARMIFGLGLAAVGFPAMAAPDPGLQAFLESTVAQVRARNHLPAVAAVVQIDGRIVAETAQGLRANGFAEKVTTGDLWHIGSDTKAMTATMIARLVERGLLRFDETMGEAFPDWAATMDPAMRKVTIVQLLSHTAGLLPVTDDKDLDSVMAIAGPASGGWQVQRANVARAFLSRPPATAVGHFAYSNLGYIIAGAIAEAHTGKPWEQLVAEEVFAPLGMMHSGFGNPALPHAHDQPWGHKPVRGRLVAIDPGSPGSDNPPLIGPAGMISLPLHDWLLFAQDQLDGVHGRGRLLKPETYARLHTVVVAPYALGWGVKPGADGKPDLLTHSGSNGYWLADIRIMPRHDIITLLVTNAGNDAANKAIVEIGKPLRDRLKPFD
ncbi:serine hydrolase domain-containing protein [Novosphingobium olei]|uniref:Beta-lactamase family protein n=1 Tax=Novosphingobium olei TaxID=2728851 RepID=A0A7Y0BNU0_9SPHN|nr:serine hydrolase domain-containing protein [Novosphingobium olei]NML93719.1 beta-lactamase family protein [Novosphingobium olei]